MYPIRFVKRKAGDLSKLLFLQWADVSWDLGVRDKQWESSRKCVAENKKIKKTHSATASSLNPEDKNEC